MGDWNPIGDDGETSASLASDGRAGWLPAPGVLEAERWLLASVHAALDAGRLDARALERPIRILVPSGSLRRHVASRLASQGAALGVTVQTLEGAAREILTRVGEPAPDATLFAVQVRREARRESALAPMMTLEAGDGALTGLVDDLLDAGFESVHAEVLAEHLDAQEVGRESEARAAAAIRVAARLCAALESGAVGHGSCLWVRAREWVERDPQAALPTRAVYLHGFADATGVQTDLLETLLRRLPATWLRIDPLNPAGESAGRPGSGFGAAFRARLEAAAPEIPFAHSGGPPSEPAPGPRIPLIVGPDRASEVRAVAERVRSELDRGTPPETIGIVARDLAPYRLALRTHLGRLAIPASGAGSVGSGTPVRRRLDALLALLAIEANPTAETWLEACEPRVLRASAHAAVSKAGVRRALHARGVARLSGVAAIEGASERAASAWLATLAARPERAPVSQHREWLEGAVADLGWRASSPGDAELASALASLDASEHFELDAEEFLGLVAHALEGAGLDPIGGAGGGVQLLTVMEARARSFAALYVLGLNRGVFPRRIEEDALLPDALRLRMREVLPELPVKREGFDEERYLLAQLAGASTHTHIAFAAADEEGRELPRSPLLDAFERAGWLGEPELATPWLALRPGLERPASPAEHALFEGLGGGRPRFARALEVALGPTHAGLAPAALPQESDVSAWVGARLATLAEMDDASLHSTSLGPYLGCVGPPASGDRRHEAPFITTLERLARCPWQAFLQKLLRLEPAPDPVGSLPAASDARLLGIVVHEALEHLFGDGEATGGASTLDALLDRPGREIPWPDESRIMAVTQSAAVALLREEGITLPGYARVLAARAWPYLEAARALESEGAPPKVLGTEIEGEAEIFDAAGERRRVRFKADRVDRVGDQLRLTDYKTGRLKINAVAEAKRADAHRAAIASGESLQAAIYARATGGVGRYVYLAPDLDLRKRVLSAHDDAAHGEVLDGAAATLFEAFDLGAFPPRLRKFAKDEEPGACRSCSVKEACVRGDSGARRRLTRFIEAEAPGRTPVEQAASRVLALDEDRT